MESPIYIFVYLTTEPVLASCVLLSSVRVSLAAGVQTGGGSAITLPKAPLDTPSAFSNQIIPYLHSR